MSCDTEDMYDECLMEDEDDDTWEETEQEPIEPTKCLFCEMKFDSQGEMFIHCAQRHSFDMQIFSKQTALDCFGYIKFVNYLRKERPDVESVLKAGSTGTVPWESEMYMQPVNPQDPLLQYDVDDLEEDMESIGNVTQSEAGNVSQNAAGNMSQTHGKEGGSVSTSEHNRLLERLKQAEERAKISEENLQRAMEDLHNIRDKTRDLMLSQSTDRNQTETQHIDEEEDDPYFSSYGHFSIHEEMLKDQVRTESYRDAMYRNEAVFRDKIVLDVGCGTGILSMFAVQAGAKHVYAVDMAEIIYQAMDIASENKLSDKITFMKGKLEDITLPVEKVDIIISEWMGYFLLFESMLDSVLFARAKYLKHDGVVYPDRCNISVSAISDLDLYNKHVTYWDDVYGFKMTCMKTCVVREASVEVIKKDSVLTDACIVKEIDVCSCGLSDLQFTSPFKLCVNKPGPITAFIGYFDIFFVKHCTQKVEFSTGPHVTPTHWKQTVFLLDTPLQCEEGDVIQGTLSCRKNRRDPRSLIIAFSFNAKTLTYYME